MEKGLNIIEKLEYSKKATIRLVESPNSLVDMHGLVYWASEVERLREVIRSF